jgi:hypothetical protein
MQFCASYRLRWWRAASRSGHKRSSAHRSHASARPDVSPNAWSNTRTNPNINACTNPRRNAGTEPNCNAQTRSDAHTEPGAHGHACTKPRRNTCAYAHAYACAHPSTDTGTYADRTANSGTYTYAAARQQCDHQPHSVCDAAAYVG